MLKLRSAVFSATAGLLLLAAGIAQADWQAGPNTPFALWRFDAEYDPGTEKVYFLGGRSGGMTGYNREVFEYDPATGAYAPTGALIPADVCNHGVNLVQDDFPEPGDRALYIIGGSDQLGPHRHVQVYSPRLNATRLVNTDPFPGEIGAGQTYVPGATVVYENRIYVFGGFNINQFPHNSDRTWVYDPLAPPGLRWTELPATLSVARGYIAAAVVDNYAYAIGGAVALGSDLTPVAVCERLDLDNPSAGWQPIAEYPVTVDETQAFGFDSDSPYEVFAGRIVVAGRGYWPYEDPTSHIYDVASDNWSAFPSLLGRRRNHAGAYIPGDANTGGRPGIWVWGGFSGLGSAVLSTAEYYQFYVPPVVAGVNPGAGERLWSGSVVIAGTHFCAPAAADFGPGIIVHTTTVNGPNQVTAAISIEPGAELGARDVSVTTPGGTSTIAAGFTVEPVSPGWREVASLPAQVGNRRDAVHRGGWLAVGPEGMVYAVKGNKLQNFYRYNPLTNAWVELAPVPFDPVRSRPLRQGSRGASDGDNNIYIVHGNNTFAFWRYNVSANTWSALADVPEGPSRKRVRGGGDLLYIEDDGVGYVYLLKGDRDEFWRYRIFGDTWEPLARPPVGVRNRWQRDSWLAFDGENTMYALKARYFDRATLTHELWHYDVAGDSWRIADTLAGMPLWGNFGGRYRRKRARDGGAGAYHDGRIYALKGGNTEQFLAYDVAADSWHELDTLPTLGTSGRRRRVNAGGDIVSVGGDVLFALKGNKTVEFWRYVVPAGMTALRPERGGVMAGVVPAGAPFVKLGPNPLVGGFATLRFQGDRVTGWSGGQVSVYDVTGREVFRQSVIGNQQSAMSLDLRALSSGVYLVKVEAGDYTASQKLVVQK